MTPSQRLKCIAVIIEAVDNRCAAADGPVTATLKEMQSWELVKIYGLATGDPKAIKRLRPNSGKSWKP